MLGQLTSVIGKQARELRRQRRIRLRKARKLRWNYRIKRLIRATLAAATMLFGTLIFAYFADGIGMEAFLLVCVMTMTAFFTLALFPRTHSLNRGKVDLPALADRTQVWLETQRNFLPAESRPLVDLLGNRLAALSPQLEQLSHSDPMTYEIRRLLEEHLPSLVQSYIGLPAGLRLQPHAGSTPHTQLLEGLNTVTREVERIGEAAAVGDLNELAIRGRFLKNRYPAQNEGPLG